FVRVRRQSPVATELVDGPTSRSRVVKAGHTVLKEKYYLDHLYTDVIVAGVKGPIADGVYWFDQNGVDEVVNQAGKQSVNAAKFVYDKVDQGIVDSTVDLTGRAAEGLGEVSRGAIQRGKVQQYAAIMFLAATVLAGAFMVFL
ncbi:MAG: hypothetical protein ACC660_02570, partial [Acidimicrobiales bacterium]